MDELIFDTMALNDDKAHSHSQMLVQDLRLRAQCLAVAFEHDLALYQDDVAVADGGDDGVVLVHDDGGDASEPLVPRNREAHRGIDQAYHTVSLRKIAPQLAGDWINMFGQKTVAIPEFEHALE